MDNILAASHATDGSCESKDTTTRMVEESEKPGLLAEIPEKWDLR